MDRRDIVGMGLLGAAALATGARAQVQAQAMGPDGFLPGDSTEFVPLWRGVAPGGEGIALTLKFTDPAQPDGYHVRSVSQIQTPGFFVYRPAQPNGLSLLVIPGGGYSSEGMDRGGREVAQHFTQGGITCFVLRYRLPGEGWARRADVPLADAQRAMRLIRIDAARYGIDAAKLSAIGFSAGGHLVASLATRHGANVYAAIDAADTRSARPVVAGLMYPVVTMGEGAHPGSRDMLLGASPSREAVDANSVERHVPANTVPSFICLAADDDVVPPFPNGIALFGALRAAKIPAALHVFEAGGHGFSIHWSEGKPCGAWPELFLAFAAAHGFTA
jgi:acetyl esterase/lipase